MFTWSPPKQVMQPGFGAAVDYSCWAATLSMWQDGMGRKKETVPSLEDRFEKMRPSPLVYVRPANRWTLDAGKFNIVAADSNVNMAWRIIKGADFIQWDLEVLLNASGFVYVVAKPPGGGGGFSHARLMYGASNEAKFALFVDPLFGSPGIMSWPYLKMREFDLILGVDKYSVPMGQDNDWVSN